MPISKTTCTVASGLQSVAAALNSSLCICGCLGTMQQSPLLYQARVAQSLTAKVCTTAAVAVADSAGPSTNAWDRHSS